MTRATWNSAGRRADQHPFRDQRSKALLPLLASAGGSELVGPLEVALLPPLNLVAVDPSAKTLTVCGFSEKPHEFPKS